MKAPSLIHKIPFKSNSLVVAMSIRCADSDEISNNVKGIKKTKLDRFCKGYNDSLTEIELRKIMKYLVFPFDFLLKDIKSVKTSLNL